MKSGRMKRILLSVIAFLFVGCSIAGGTVLLSNSSISDSNRGGDSTSSENELTKNAPTNSDLWTNGHYATAFGNEDEAGIDGTTEEKAYEIRTAEQLALLAYRINTSSTNSTYKSLYYVQTADIDLSLHYWDAIGTSSYYFSGCYDGGGFEISGVYIESSNSYVAGLFGYINGQSETDTVTIKNVGIINSNVKGGRYVGGVVGSANKSIITNCYNTGSVVSSSASLGCAGGIAGYFNKDTVTISNCHNTSSITSSGYCGGIVGDATISAVINCYNTGDVSGVDSVGGIAGEKKGITINCYNTGNISGNENVGGIIGRGYRYNVIPNVATIRNCYNTGNISGNENVGGILGYISAALIINCYNTGNVNGKYAGGILGYSNSSINYQLSNNYYGGNCSLTYGIGHPASNTGTTKDENLITNAKSISWYQDSSKWDSSYPWDFEGAWQIDSNKNDGYPYLSGNLYGSHKPNNPTQYWTDEGNYATAFAGGSGTESAPYEIATPEQLARLAYLVNSGSEEYMFSNTYFVQTANLDMSEYWWEAIGTTSRYFSGHYDGGGYTISVLYTQRDKNYQGLFGYVRGQSNSNRATIKNVGIINSYIQGYSCVGGVAGCAYYSDITNCYYTGSIFGYVNHIGGVVGYANYSTVTNCYVFGFVTAYLNIGGVVGYAYTSSSIKSCHYAGSVTGYYAVGGILGNGDDCVVVQCYNIGSVTGKSSTIGGISGCGGSVRYCYNAGSVTSESSGAVGGIVGDGVSVAYCYNTGSVTGKSGSVGGIVGSGDDCGINYCYNTGSVTSESSGAVGGIVGSGDCAVLRCYNTGSVAGGGDYVGGIVGGGVFFAGTISTCYNTGSVAGGGDYVGGIVGGSNSMNYDAIYCYNTGSVTGNGSHVRGISGAVYSASSYNYYGGNCTLTSGGGGTRDENLFANARDLSWYQDSSKWSSSYYWNFESTWMFIDGMNDGYPILQALMPAITYNSNYGEKETISNRVSMGQEIVIESYDLFNRVGYDLVCWNTSSTGSGTSYYAGDKYACWTRLTLYAQWEAKIIQVNLDENGGSGGTSAIYLKYDSGWYSSSSCTSSSKITSLPSTPTRTGYEFNGYSTEPDGSGTLAVSETGAINVSDTFYSTDGARTWYAVWEARNPAYYDSEGGYWYIENGKLPQSKVSESLKQTLSSSWDSLTYGDVYYMGVEELADGDSTTDGGMQSKVYNGEEYVKFNGEFYLVEPIRWRLVYSSSQQEGYAVENTSVLATMAEIVFLGSYSSAKIGAGEGYSAESVTMLLKNQVSTEFLVSESREVEIFGAPKDTTTVSGSVFVASMEELANFTTNKNNTTGSGVKAGKASFSDFVKDYLRATGQGDYYFTRDLGDQLNTIHCLNPVGDRSQAKAQQTLGVQFTIKVTEYACKSV